jgi:hypothetical protein
MASPESQSPLPGSRLAKTAILSGLLAPLTCGFGSLVGIILGGLAIIRIRKAGGNQRTEKIAVAGILTSVICLPLSLLVAIQVIARMQR